MTIAVGSVVGEHRSACQRTVHPAMPPVKYFSARAAFL
jgi:hypothetical protein